MDTRTKKVIITGDALQVFEVLNTETGKEVERGITSSEKQTLLNAIKRKIEQLKIEPDSGIHIPKDRMPREYEKKYDVTNLWEIDLPGHWRMIYTIRGNKIEIISLVIDIFNHKEYNKKFGY